MTKVQRIEVYFDGACPICSREMAIVRKLDRNNAIACTDIAARDFDANDFGLDAEALNRQIHGRLGDGRIVTGVEVFRQIYERLGFRRSVALSRRPWIARVLERLYAVFAKHRQTITQPIRWMRGLGT
jgi:predicted DCC family thiol-disulfide oxidoreductase YuxK